MRDGSGFIASAGTTARLILGWAFAGLGVLNLAMGSAGASYLLFHVTLLVTAVALMGFGSLRRAPSRIAWLVAAVATLLGLALSSIWHGYPFPVRGGVLLGADVVFWGSAGFLVLTVITLLGGAPAESTPPRTSPAHAEGRAAEAEAPRDESVGGLP